MSPSNTTTKRKRSFGDELDPNLSDELDPRIKKFLGGRNDVSGKENLDPKAANRCGAPVKKKSKNSARGSEIVTSIEEVQVGSGQDQDENSPNSVKASSTDRSAPQDQEDMLDQTPPEYDSGPDDVPEKTKGHVECRDVLIAGMSYALENLATIGDLLYKPGGAVRVYMAHSGMNDENLNSVVELMRVSNRAHKRLLEYCSRIQRESK